MLGLTDRAEHAIGPAPRHKGLYLGRPKVSTIVAKSPGNQKLEEGQVASGSTLKLSFGAIAPTKHPVVADVNPALLEYGQVSLCGRYLPGETAELAVYLTLFKPTKVEELPEWMVRLGLDAQATL